MQNKIFNTCSHLVILLAKKIKRENCKVHIINFTGKRGEKINRFDLASI